MTYNSKRTIASMITGIVLFISYAVYAFQKYSQGITEIKFWAVAMLVFIGIGVAGAIVIQIIFHIVYAIGIAVKERDQSDRDVERMIAASVVEDERDKLINLKSAHIGYIIAGIGFISALISLALGSSEIFALHLVFGTFAIGSFVEGGISVYLYERGVHNG